MPRFLQYDNPSSLQYIPLDMLPDNNRNQFERLSTISIWPEVGSRAMQRLAFSQNNEPEWIVVQPGRYRYVAFVDDSVIVRMVLSEYLACEVIWI